MTDDTWIGQVNHWFKFLTNSVRWCIITPVWHDLTWGISTDLRCWGTNRPTTHSNLILLTILSADVHRYNLSMLKHGIVDKPVEDIQASSNGFRRWENLLCVFIFLWESVEVEVMTTNRNGRLAANPIMQTDLCWWVNAVLDVDRYGLSTRCRRSNVAFLSIKRCDAENERRIAIEYESNRVVTGIGKGWSIWKVNGFYRENHSAWSGFNRRHEGKIVGSKVWIWLLGKNNGLADRIAVIGDVLAKHPQIEFTGQWWKLWGFKVNLSKER